MATFQALKDEGKAALALVPYVALALFSDWAEYVNAAAPASLEFFGRLPRTALMTPSSALFSSLCRGPALSLFVSWPAVCVSRPNDRPALVVSGPSALCSGPGALCVGARHSLSALLVSGPRALCVGARATQPVPPSIHATHEPSTDHPCSPTSLLARPRTHRPVVHKPSSLHLAVHRPSTQTSLFPHLTHTLPPTSQPAVHRPSPVRGRSVDGRVVSGLGLDIEKDRSSCHRSHRSTGEDRPA